MRSRNDVISQGQLPSATWHVLFCAIWILVPLREFNSMGGGMDFAARKIISVVIETNFLRHQVTFASRFSWNFASLVRPDGTRFFIMARSILFHSNTDFWKIIADLQHLFITVWIIFVEINLQATKLHFCRRIYYFHIPVCLRNTDSDFVAGHITPATSFHFNQPIFSLQSLNYDHAKTTYAIWLESNLTRPSYHKFDYGSHAVWKTWPRRFSRGKTRLEAEFLSLLGPEGHIFHMAWGTMVKSHCIPSIDLFCFGAMKQPLCISQHAWLKNSYVAINLLSSNTGVTENIGACHCC